MSDKSIERVIKSLIEEKSLIRLLRTLEESTRTGNNEIVNKKSKIILKDISNRFYN